MAHAVSYHAFLVSLCITDVCVCVGGAQEKESSCVKCICPCGFQAKLLSDSVLGFAVFHLCMFAGPSFVSSGKADLFAFLFSLIFL